MRQAVSLISPNRSDDGGDTKDGQRDCGGDQEVDRRTVDVHEKYLSPRIEDQSSTTQRGHRSAARELTHLVTNLSQAALGFSSML